MEGRTLGPALGSELEVGEIEGASDGFADAVGERVVEGTAEGDRDGNDEADGARLIDGTCDGHLHKSRKYESRETSGETDLVKNEKRRRQNSP